MTLRPSWWPEALQHLAGAQQAFAEIDRLAVERAWRSPRGEAFSSLARAIVGQQISVRAADSVWRKLVDACGGTLGDGADDGIRPQTLASLGTAALRGCGLSGRKAEYVQALAEHFLAPGFSAERLAAQDDAAIVAELSGIRGIGVWTAEMYLMFHLQRPDVLPVADLGVRAGAGSLFGNGTPLGAADLRRLAADWSPFSSAASWLLWRYTEFGEEQRLLVRSLVRGVARA